MFGREFLFCFSFSFLSAGIHHVSLNGDAKSRQTHVDGCTASSTPSREDEGRQRCQENNNNNKKKRIEKKGKYKYATKEEKRIQKENVSPHCHHYHNHVHLRLLMQHQSKITKKGKAKRQETASIKQKRKKKPSENTSKSLFSVRFFLFFCAVVVDFLFFSSHLSVPIYRCDGI